MMTLALNRHFLVLDHCVAAVAKHILTICIPTGHRGTVIQFVIPISIAVRLLLKLDILVDTRHAPLQVPNELLDLSPGYIVHRSKFIASGQEMVIALPEPHHLLTTQTPSIGHAAKRSHQFVRIVPEETLLHVVQLLPRTECHRLRRWAIILVRKSPSRVEVRHVLSVHPEIAEVLEGRSRAEMVLILNLLVVVVVLVVLIVDEGIVVVVS